MFPGNINSKVGLQFPPSTVTSGAIGSGAIASGSVVTNSIASGAVNNTKIGQLAVRSGHLLAGAPSSFSGQKSVFGSTDATQVGNIQAGTVSFYELSSGLGVQGILGAVVPGHGNILSGSIGLADLGSGLIQSVLQTAITGIASGEKGDIIVPYDSTLNYLTLTSDQSGGSCFLGIWRDTAANYPPTSGDTIAASGVPLISGAIFNTYSGVETLSGWSTAFTKGDIIKFVVHSGLTMTRVNVALQIGMR